MNLDVRPRRAEKAARTTKSVATPRRPGGDRRIELAEVAILAAIGGVAVVGWAALLLAQAGRYSLVAVTAVAAIAAAVIVGALWRTAEVSAPAAARPAASVGATALAVVTFVVSLAAFLPGAPYALPDKDPGVYVIHGASIAREGSISVPDDLRAEGAELLERGPGARFAGLWTEGSTTSITPQFYHLYPALLAVAHDLGGLSAEFHMNPLLGALSVVALALAARSAAGGIAGWLTAAFLVTNMLQVWQAKYPTTEILTQLLVGGALLGALVAMRTGLRAPAGAAGVFAGLTFLARPDGLVVVLLGLGVAAVAAIVLPRDHRPRWFAAGVAITLPHGLVNAYDLRRVYSLANDLPDLGLTLAALGALAVGVGAGLALRRVPEVSRRLNPGHPWWPSVARVGAILAALGSVVALGWFFRRPDLGEVYFDYNGQSIRSYDELNLRRLTFFWPLRAVALGLLGVVALGFWRRKPSAWLLGGVLLPTVPLFLWAAKNSPRLMWWGRRYVPMALPALILLAAIGAAWLLSRHRPLVLRLAMLALVGSILVETATMSSELVGHREFGGSAALVEQAAEATEGGIVLFERPADGDLFSLNRNLPGALWLVHDRPAADLDPRAPQFTVDEVRAALPGRPVFVFVEDGTPPEDLVDDLTLVEELSATFSIWEETVGERPDEAISLTRTTQIYRYEPDRSSP